MSRYYDSDDNDYKEERDELESEGGDDDDEKQRIADASRSNTLVGELEEPRPANYSGQTLYSRMSFPLWSSSWLTVYRRDDDGERH